MMAEFNGIKVKIPRGYNGLDENGFYMNGHGVEYALVSYGSGEVVWKQFTAIMCGRFH